MEPGIHIVVSQSRWSRLGGVSLDTHGLSSEQRRAWMVEQVGSNTGVVVHLLVASNACVSRQVKGNERIKGREQARFLLEEIAPFDAEALYCVWELGRDGGLVVGARRAVIDEAVEATEAAGGRVGSCAPLALVAAGLISESSRPSIVEVEENEQGVQCLGLGKEVPQIWLSSNGAALQRLVIQQEVRKAVGDQAIEASVQLMKAADIESRLVGYRVRPAIDFVRDPFWNGRRVRIGLSVTEWSFVVLGSCLAISALLILFDYSRLASLAASYRSNSQELTAQRLGAQAGGASGRRLKSRVDAMRRFAEAESFLAPGEHPMTQLLDALENSKQSPPIRLRRVTADGEKLVIEGSADGLEDAQELMKTLEGRGWRVNGSPALQFRLEASRDQGERSGSSSEDFR